MLATAGLRPARLDTGQNKPRSMAHGNYRTSNGTRRSRGDLRSFLFELVRLAA